MSKHISNCGIATLIKRNNEPEPSSQKQPSPVVRIEFNACYVRGEDTYLWETYKTFGGARRFIRNHPDLLAWMDGWYIERVKRWRDENGKVRGSGVILAMQRDIVVRNRFKVIA